MYRKGVLKIGFVDVNGAYPFDLFPFYSLSPRMLKKIKILDNLVEPEDYQEILARNTTYHRRPALLVNFRRDLDKYRSILYKQAVYISYLTYDREEIIIEASLSSHGCRHWRGAFMWFTQKILKKIQTESAREIRARVKLIVGDKIRTESFTCARKDVAGKALMIYDKWIKKENYNKPIFIDERRLEADLI